jgi:hypothetical protein
MSTKQSSLEINTEDPETTTENAIKSKGLCTKTEIPSPVFTLPSETHHLIARGREGPARISIEGLPIGG